MVNMHKLYLVNFKVDGKRCFKVGITSSIDVTKRFQRLITSGDIKEFKVYKSSYFDSYDDAYNAEQLLMSEIISIYGGYDHNGEIKFHNFWSKNKLSGITEIRKYKQDEVSYAWNYINKNGKKTFKKA
mgnify:FL=1